MWYAVAAIVGLIIGYRFGRKMTKLIRKEVHDDLINRPSYRREPRRRSLQSQTASEKIICEIEKHRPHIIRFRWGEDTAILLVEAPHETQMECRGNHRTQRVIQRYAFGRVIGPRHWIEAMEQCFKEPVGQRRDLYLRPQQGGKNTIIQRPKVTCLGAKNHLDGDMVCLYSVTFDTCAEPITRSEESITII